MSAPPTPSPPLGPARRPDDEADSWARLYRIGGVSGLVFLALVGLPMVLVLAFPVPPVEGEAVLRFISTHKALYVTELVCFVGLSVPALLVFAAAAVALRRVDPGIAAIGGLVGIASEIVALSVGSSPQSLHGGLVVLSSSYEQSGTAAERAGLADSANALIAATNAVTWAGILTAAAILVLSWLVRPGGLGQGLALLGMATGVIGIASEALRPLIGPAYLVYGLLLPTWFTLMGLRLLRLGRRRET
ncbi:MAG: hypothetical protein V9F82_07220 [Dermatophilaceae bacterium]